jgi:hypothetical protein
MLLIAAALFIVFFSLFLAYHWNVTWSAKSVEQLRAAYELHVHAR